VELQEGLGLGLVSDQKPNVSISSRSRKLRSRLHPCYKHCQRQALLEKYYKLTFVWEQLDRLL